MLLLTVTNHSFLVDRMIVWHARCHVTKLVRRDVLGLVGRALLTALDAAEQSVNSLVLPFREEISFG